MFGNSSEGRELHFVLWKPRTKENAALALDTETDHWLIMQFGCEEVIFWNDELKPVFVAKIPVHVICSWHSKSKDV